MRHHVVVQVGKEDGFRPPVAHGDEVLRVPLFVAGAPEPVSLSVADTLAEYALTPSTSANDLLFAAIGAYTADTRLARRTGYDGWTRDITLYLPVQDVAAWADALPPFERLLRFLTGDHWQVAVRAATAPSVLPPTRPPAHVRTVLSRTVCLFSGGLDSFIGAADLLSTGESILLVGHHSQGGGATSSSQTRALRALHDRFTPEQAPFLRLWVSPPKGPTRASEITTRGRSVLFLGLGICVASTLPNSRLVVPENGLISLNVPLTDSRLGSLSTRTTHPYLIFLLRQILSALDIRVGVELPYRFKTKGEMIAECKEQALVRAGVAATMSCARPNASRFEGQANQHCGYCLPCLIRRAAFTGAFGKDDTVYTRDVLRDALSPGRKSDLRAVRMALLRYAKRPPRMADVLVPGPLPASDSELREYLGVFQRGIAELRNLLK